MSSSTTNEEQPLIYLDYNATTPIDSIVSSAMIPYMTEHFGNPSSSHHYGTITKKAITQSRIQVSQLLNCHPEEIIFTSGGTESNNYAIKGIVENALLNITSSDNTFIHCITSRVEHPSVMEVFKFLEHRYGTNRVQVTYCGVDEYGMIRLDEFNKALRRETILVSVMHSHNEVGTLQPIREIGKLIRNFEKENAMERNSIILHTDAAQSIGKTLISLYEKPLYSNLTNSINNSDEKEEEMIVDRNEIRNKLMNLNDSFVSDLFGANNDDEDITPVHLLSICTHKFYGPKGVGALFIRRNCGIKLEKQVHGASVHERGYRSGTENVILVVGLGKACEQCLVHMVDRVSHMLATRDNLYNGLLNNLSKIVMMKLNGHPERRLPNTLNISFAGIEANTILDDLSQYIAASAGSACHSSPHDDDDGHEVPAEKKIIISQILTEMGVDVQIAMGTIRFSTGILLTNDQVESAILHVTQTISKLSGGSAINDSSDFITNHAVSSSPLSKNTGLADAGNMIVNSNNNGLDLLSMMLTKETNVKDEVIISSTSSSTTPPQIKLTSTTHGLGCGCKIRAQTLSSILSNIPKQPFDPNVLVGTETSDDCGVYKLTNDLALCATVDFFTPIVDSPKDFGSIACANALSDVYAMGGECRVALNIVAFPVKRLSLNILQLILQGAQEKANEAGVTIIGGHSIEDNEPKFGMCVSGLVHPERIWKNVGCRNGDVLLLTKPIGTGVLTTAMKKGLIGPNDDCSKKCIEWMSMLNKTASEILRGLYRITTTTTDSNNNSTTTELTTTAESRPYNIHACTDITGFGLMGHLREMITGGSNNLYAQIESDQVPFMDKAYEMILSDVIPGGTVNNMNFIQKVTRFNESVSEIVRTLLCDAQTSGGLLLSVSKEESEEIISDFKRLGAPIWVIGSIKQHGDDEKSSSGAGAGNDDEYAIHVL